MKFIKKMFGGIDLTWTKLVIAAVIAGVYTGAMAAIPLFENTSFEDISISFEWWILFGILIIMNSKSNLDSALKCFVFFLISQPLAYLVQVPFAEQGFGLFIYYRRWFIWTLFTFPMGWIGYYMKKNSLLAVVILTPMLVFLGVHLHSFLREAVSSFPHHLLSALFCAVTMFLYVTAIVAAKREKTVGYALCGVILAVCLALGVSGGLSGSSDYCTTIKCSDESCRFDESSRVSLEDESFGTVYIDLLDVGEESVPAIYAELRKLGTTKLILETDSERYEFELTVGKNTYHLEPLTP